MRRDVAERLRAGERLLLDGATGSELQRRKVDLSHGITEGGDLGAWSATAMGEAPDQVRAVHEGQRRPGQPWHVLEAPDYPPERFAGFGRQWLDLGAQVIGGCCATTPDHIAALRRLF